MKSRFLFLCMIMVTGFLKAQDTVLLSHEQLEKIRAYTSLDEALKEPEKVIVLDLSGQGLDSVPESIAQLKNLQVLKLGYKIKDSTPKRVVKKSKKVGGGIVHLDGLSGKYLAYNHIKKIPPVLGELPKLQEVYLHYNAFIEVPFELALLPNVKYINLVGCYGLLKKEEGLRELKSKLPPACVLRTDIYKL